MHKNESLGYYLTHNYTSLFMFNTKITFCGMKLNHINGCPWLTENVQLQELRNIYLSLRLYFFYFLLIIVVFIMFV